MVGSSFCREPILQNVWIILSPLLSFNFKSFWDPSSSPFISFQFILYDSGGLLLGFPNLYNLKRGEFSFWGEPICQNVWIIWSPLLHLNFKSFLDPNYSSFIRFQSILHESGRVSSESWNFCKLKWRDLISGLNQFCRMCELFGPPICISILKVF